MSSYFKARDELVKMYIKSLEEGRIPWEKMWQTNIPENGITGKKYKGVNNLILSYVAIQRGYKDNRIRLIDNEYNMGLSGCLNKGISLAKGMEKQLDQIEGKIQILMTEPVPMEKDNPPQMDLFSDDSELNGTRK